MYSEKTAVYLNTIGKTCTDCGLKYYCWERRKAHSVSVFKQIEKMLENGAALSPQTLPNQFGTECIQSERLIKNFIIEHNVYTANRLAKQRADALRTAVRVQFGALSELLFDLSEELEDTLFEQKEQSDLLEELLTYCQAEYSHADVFSTAQYRTVVIIKVPFRQEVLEKDAFLKDLESICRRGFCAPVITPYAGSFKLAYFEKPLYTIETGEFQIPADGNRACGDVMESFRDFRGNSGIVLADGMGKGIDANINASIGAGMMAKLLASGFSPAAAIKVVNAVLMLKDNDESFSSLDVLLFDGYEAKACFYKAGATTTFIKRKHKITRLELSCLPVGILENADFARRSLTLEAGDVILMVSDGVTQGNCEWVDKLLIAEQYQTPLSLAKAVCESAAKAQGNAHEDDISAAAMFVRRA